MATFLELLKQKNITAGVSNIPANHAIKIDSNFGTKDQTIVDLTPDTKPDPITVRCERVLDRNRIDLFFSAIPSEETRTLLKDQGFKFNPDSKAWYHKDCLVNRMFLTATFDLPDLMQDVYNDDPKMDVKTNINSYATYKDQVNALLTELKLDCADLMIVAIDSLYNRTFKDIN